MEIGDRVVIGRNRKRGVTSFYEYITKKGKIIKKYPNFYLVRLDKGYCECFRKEDLSKEE